MSFASAVGDSQTVSVEDGTRTLQWSLHRARQSPRKAVAVVLLILTVAAMCGFLMSHWVPALFALLCLTGSIADYLFPVRFLLNESGARLLGAGIDREMKWTAVRRVDHGAGWIHLSPFRTVTRLDRFRGIDLLFNADDDELRREILAKIGAHASGVTA